MKQKRILNEIHLHLTLLILMKPLLLLPLLLTNYLISQSLNWHHLDPKKDSILGISSLKFYTTTLPPSQIPSTVIVAILDCGVDFLHEDLKNVIWTNPGEIPNNGIDDDNNGYTDDIHGWNFIGGNNGKNVEFDNLELTRLIRKFRPIYQGNDSIKQAKSNPQEFEFYMSLKREYHIQYKSHLQTLSQLSEMKEKYSHLNSTAKKQLQKDSIGTNELFDFKPGTTGEFKSKSEAIRFLKSGTFRNLDDLLSELNDNLKVYENFINYALNLDFDPRYLVGDNYSDSNEKHYGNPDCKGPDSFHGTHVAGIIAAERNNGIGCDGIAGNVKIMALRCVPNGDERDKDVANAIYYAVNNGAKILNMSFGKKYYWDKKTVDQAIKYAEKKNVLIVHGAGNDHENTDSVFYYPNKKFLNKKTAKNFIEVGATSWIKNQNLVADFSNYGKKNLDLFAPGFNIYSTAPNNSYKSASGTSMAAPVVSGVAAVVLSYYPDLKAKDLKKILLQSSLKTVAEEIVLQPGTNKLVKFKSLSNTGGIVNLFESMQLAKQYSKVKP